MKKVKKKAIFRSNFTLFKMQFKYYLYILFTFLLASIVVLFPLENKTTDYSRYITLLFLTVCMYVCLCVSVFVFVYRYASALVC